MYYSRYFVNFPSCVDGTMLCQFFKTYDAAEKFARRFKLKCFYEVRVFSEDDHFLKFVDSEIERYNKNIDYYHFESHFYGEIPIYLKYND